MAWIAILIARYSGALDQIPLAVIITWGMMDAAGISPLFPSDSVLDLAVHCRRHPLHRLVTGVAGTNSPVGGRFLVAGLSVGQHFHV